MKTLFLYNSLSRAKQAFAPIDPGHVRLYACGPTVYNYAHIGNARMAVVFDLLSRTLRSIYPKVTYVSNITDIDDKIIDAARETGADITDITVKFGRIYNEDIQGFDEMVIVKNIDFTSHCEHHMVPIEGVAHVAYWPNEKVVGISKLARVVDIFSKRLVSQESMTQQVVEAIEAALAPKGVAVLIEAAHECMSTRGVNKANSLTVTSLFSGVFKTDRDVQRRFLDLAGK